MFCVNSVGTKRGWEKVGKRPRRDDSRRGARWAASYVTLLNICLSRSQSHTHSRSSFHPVLHSNSAASSFRRRCRYCQRHLRACISSLILSSCACNLISCASEAADATGVSRDRATWANNSRPIVIGCYWRFIPMVEMDRGSRESSDVRRVSDRTSRIVLEHTWFHGIFFVFTRHD